MRDHLFHAEEEETSFRVFREERQIRYAISPVNNRVSFHFPLGYSICVQVSVDEKRESKETKNGFHLPLGHMEKTEFRIQQWYCFRNKSATIAQLMKRIRWVCLFITSLTDCDKSGFRHVFIQHTHYPLEETKQTTEEVPSSLPENQPPQSEENSLPVAKVNRTGDELLLKQIKTIRDTVRMDQDLLHLGSNQALKNLPQLIQQVQKNKNPLLISEVGFVFAFSFPASQSLHHHV